MRRAERHTVHNPALGRWRQEGQPQLLSEWEANSFLRPCLKNKQGGGTQTSSGNDSQPRLRGARTARFFTQPPFVPHSSLRTGRSVRKAKADGIPALKAGQGRMQQSKAGVVG